VLADRRYLLGKAFSAADIMSGYSLMLATRLVPRRFPSSVAAYWQRLSERPGYVAAIAHDA